MKGVIIVMPSKNFLAIRTDVLKQRDLSHPRIPRVSTGVLLISKTNFTLLNWEKGSADMKPKIEKSGSVMMKSGFEIMI
jgi:hypothetical protein